MSSFVAEIITRLTVIRHLLLSLWLRQSVQLQCRSMFDFVLSIFVVGIEKRSKVDNDVCMNEAILFIERNCIANYLCVFLLRVGNVSALWQCLSPHSQAREKIKSFALS